jgi:hypothetical protein
MSESENITIYPSDKTLKNAAKLSIQDDRPIMLDYWTESYEESPTVMIGVKTNEDKLLVRSSEEFTSPISKIFKVEEEYIIVTENSIYIVSCKIPTRRIS